MSQSNNLDDEDTAAAILRVCSYHNRGYAQALIRSLPGAHDAVATSLQTAFPMPPPDTDRPRPRRGFAALPPELMTMILRDLDLRSYFHFRQISRQTRLAATQLREYALLATHGLEALRAVLRSGLARIYTITRLFDILTTRCCDNCRRRFGGYLFLLEAQRVCFACIEGSKSLCVLSVPLLAATARISETQLRRRLGGLTLRTVPGTYVYNTMAPCGPRPVEVVAEGDVKGCRDMTLRIAVDTCPRQFQGRFMACTALPWYDTQHERVEDGICCKGCRVRVEDTKARRWQDSERVFSRDEFLEEHVGTCKEAQEIWERSEHGRVVVEDSEFLRRGGADPDLDDAARFT